MQEVFQGPVLGGGLIQGRLYISRVGSEQADRVVDLLGLLDRAPRGLRPTLLGVGPEAARPVGADLRLAALNEALTQRITSRLERAAAPQAYTPAPTCRLVAFTLSEGQRAPRPPRQAASAAGGTPALQPGHAGRRGDHRCGVGVHDGALRDLAASATSECGRRPGADLDRPSLCVEGPIEVRQAAAAFNAMQVDLKRHQAKCTHMLAAITHDLKTPLPRLRLRLRLRLEKVRDDELRDQLLDDQAAMVELVREGPDLAHAASSQSEPAQELDVDSLLESLCARSRRSSAARPTCSTTPSSMRASPNSTRSRIVARSAVAPQPWDRHPGRGGGERLRSNLSARNLAVARLGCCRSRIDDRTPAGGMRRWTLDAGWAIGRRP